MAQQCSAKSKQTGQRCRQPAILGGTVCRFHGGTAPQVKKKAQERLRELVDPALDALTKIIENVETTDSDKVRAANSVLDRVRETAKVSKQELSGPDGAAIAFDIDSQIDKLIGGKKKAKRG